MLNETWRVCHALEHAQIAYDLPHPLISPLPASENNLLRIRLNEKGYDHKYRLDSLISMGYAHGTCHTLS